MSESADLPSSGAVQLGAITIALEADNPLWAETFGSHFRCAVDAVVPSRPNLVVSVKSRPGRIKLAKGFEQALEVERAGSRLRYHVDLMTLTADVTKTPVRVDIEVFDEEQEAELLQHFFMMFLDKLLLALGVFRLHGAAIELGGATNVFLGDKGAGKSTLSLALGFAGGSVLADDQLLARRNGSGVAVSGVDGNVRLTTQTESHFLDAPLAIEPREYAGVPKKQVPLASLVPALPHEERMPKRLFFPRVASGFAVEPISQRDAVARILNDFARTQRFGDATDRANLMGLVVEFVRPLEAADLELSPDLGELDSLVEFLTE